MRAALQELVRDCIPHGWVAELRSGYSYEMDGYTSTLHVASTPDVLGRRHVGFVPLIPGHLTHDGLRHAIHMECCRVSDRGTWELTLMEEDTPSSRNGIPTPSMCPDTQRGKDTPPHPKSEA